MLNRLRRGAGKQPETLGPWGVTVLHHGSVSWCPGQPWWDWEEAAGTYGCIHIIYVYIYIYIMCIYIYVYYIVIGVEPNHPGSWQFPKLQVVKNDRWSNLLCNIQPDTVEGPCHTPKPQLHRKC